MPQLSRITPYVGNNPSPASTATPLAHNVFVVVRPAPFADYCDHYHASSEETITEIINRIFGPDHDAPTVVIIGDTRIFQRNWSRVRPRSGVTINIFVVPMGGGGGGKNPLKTVLSIAVLAAGAYLGPTIAAQFALPWGAQAATFNAISLGVKAAVGVVGNLISNAIAPPSAPRSSASLANNQAESQTFFIQGATNDIRPFDPVPVILGRHRFVPPQAAFPYTETEGDDQYVRQLFCWGLGNHIELSDVKIGETLLSEFDGVELEHMLEGNMDATSSLFPDDVVQEDFNILVDEASGYQLRTTSPDADEIQVDFTFPRGLAVFDSAGNRQSNEVELEVQYAPTGTESWVTAENLTINASQTNALRRSVRFTVTRGQYDVRYRRLTPDSDSDQEFSEVYFSALRTITYRIPVNQPNVNGTALRIKGTNQLNGSVDQLNAIVQSVIPDYDVNTGTWVTRATSNPASLARFVLQGVGNAKPVPDSAIHFAAFEEWHDFCRERGFSYNAIIDTTFAITDLLADIAAAGRASMTVHESKWSVIIDTIRPNYVQHFTPYNSFGYAGEMVYPDLPHGFRVQFQNEEKGYVTDEIIVYADGYDESNATEFERLELNGVTTADQAWKLAREHLATAKLRPEIHTFYTDVEYLVATRGDRIKFSHDVILVGISAGRIASVLTDGGDPEQVIGFTLDQLAVMESGKSYTIRIRGNSGNQHHYALVTNPGEQTTIMLQSPAPIATAARADDIYSFGESGSETIDLVIQAIEPGTELTARLRCVDYAPEIFDAASGTIPVFNPQITTPPEFERPRAPVIQTVQTGEEVMIRHSDGSLATRMVITLQNQNQGDVEVFAEIRQTGTLVFAPAKIVSSSPTQLSIEDCIDGQRYDVRVYYKRPDSITRLISAAASQNNILFIGASAAPEDIARFDFAVVDTLALFDWDPAGNIDLSHYIIKYSPDYEGVTWSSSQTVRDNITINEVLLPYRAGTYSIKAVDRSGNQSVNARFIQIRGDAITRFNQVITLSPGPTWAGTLTDLEINNGALRLSDSINQLTGLYEAADIIDLGAVFTSRITLRLSTAGSNVSNVVANWPNLSSIENLSGTEAAAWGVEAEYSITDDDPNGSPTWSDWRRLGLTDLTFRAIRFRVHLTSYVPGVTPRLADLDIELEMPSRIEEGSDILIPAGGATVTYSSAFKNIPTPAITAQSLSEGDEWDITNKTESGFTITFRDFQQNDVARTIDYIASGYGINQT